MEKEFIPYEQALALKELGFNRKTFAQYNTRRGNGWLLTFDLSGEGQYTGNGGPCVAPTFSQAFRWFREEYGLRIRNYGSMNYSGALSEYFEIFKYGYGTSNKSLSIEVGALTYEEAELECLKKLIEIVKEKK